MVLLDNGRGACCRIEAHRNLNIHTSFMLTAAPPVPELDRSPKK